MLRRDIEIFDNLRDGVCVRQSVFGVDSEHPCYVSRVQCAAVAANRRDGDSERLIRAVQKADDFVCRRVCLRKSRKRELGGINTEYNVYKREVESAEDIKRFAVKMMFPDAAQERQYQKEKTKSKGIEI
ncbi:hypothetical protein FACS189425_05140 [Clostridia bacterium]|nr:hypothetical protein FACS189425_05140 [Clostridia bacterium]